MLRDPSPLDGLKLPTPKLLISTRKSFSELYSELNFPHAVNWWIKVIEKGTLEVEGNFDSIKKFPNYTDAATLKEVLEVLELDSDVITGSNAKTNVESFHKEVRTEISVL